ncbi:MAG: 16S rRNA (guanine(527)-N(7))-methyltransferase RsmG [Pseudomonadota bacterium]
MSKNLSSVLTAGAQQLGLDLNEVQVGQLLQFVELLTKWNKTYNLTAIDDPQEMLSKHILDSLSVSKYLVGEKILDIGSGAGLPGLPLSITHAEKQFTLLDSNLKKTRFMQQVAIELKLQNVEVVNQRIQTFQPAINHSFSTVVSRAFADSTSFINQCSHVISQGRLIFMLGKQKQLEALPKSYNVLEISSVTIPQLDAQRHIAVVEKNSQ